MTGDNQEHGVTRRSIRKRQKPKGMGVMSTGGLSSVRCRCVTLHYVWKCSLQAAEAQV